MSDIHIRRATPADASAIVAFNLAMAAETEGRRLDREVASHGVRRVLADPSLGVYYLAEQAGSVVGQLLITTEFSDWRDGVFWWIQSVYVHPSARRYGVYRALHEHVERRARRTNGVRGLRLYVAEHNAAAQSVYRSLGLTRSDYDLYELDWSTESAGQP